MTCPSLEKVAAGFTKSGRNIIPTNLILNFAGASEFSLIMPTIFLDRKNKVGVRPGHLSTQESKLLNNIRL
jgi:hypothetical protein